MNRLTIGLVLAIWAMIMFIFAACGSPPVDTSQAQPDTYNQLYVYKDGAVTCYRVGNHDGIWCFEGAGGR